MHSNAAAAVAHLREQFFDGWSALRAVSAVSGAAPGSRQQEINGDQGTAWVEGFFKQYAHPDEGSDGVSCSVYIHGLKRQRPVVL